MLKTKSCKIILLLTAVVMFITAFVMLTSSRTVSAASDVTSYFTSLNTTVAFNNDNVEVTAEDGGNIELKKDLVADALAIETKIGADIEKVTVNFTTKAFDVNADENNHAIELTVGESFKFDNIEGATTVTADTTVYFKVVDSALNVSLDNVNFVATAKLSAHLDNVIAEDIKFTFKVKENATANVFSIVSIDQDYNDAEGNYKQAFKLDESNNIEKNAKPVISLNENEKLYLFDGEKYTLSALLGEKYTLTFKAYSVLGNDTTATDYAIAVDEAVAPNVWLSNETKPNDVVFYAEGDVEFNVEKNETNSKKYTIDVNKLTSANTAPEYIDTADLTEYQKALEKATKAEDKDYCIRLGEKVKLPSMKNIVKDDTTAYADLSHTVYYSTPTTTSSTTSWEIPVEDAGTYFFYVVFEDKQDEKMDKASFETVIASGEDGQVIPYNKDKVDANVYDSVGANAKYVFSFTIIDDAPISVTSIKQKTGYINTAYTASSFTIDYSGYTPSYELFYNANSTAEVGELKAEDGWVKIEASSKVSETDIFASGFDYDTVVEINYDGKLTFTPDRVGKYVIKCTVQSTNSVRSESATAEITISETPKVVKPASRWLQDNVWSVVFLGIGTLCLAGIIVLLCIKPKEETEEKIDE